MERCPLGLGLVIRQRRLQQGDQRRDHRGPGQELLTEGLGQSSLLGTEVRTRAWGDAVASGLSRWSRGVMGWSSLPHCW